MGDINEIIQFRLKRSSEAFKEALLLYNVEHYNSAVNRLYYLAFYSISALLLKYEIYSKTHSGLKSKFNQLFSQEKKFSQEEANTFNELFQ